MGSIELTKHEHLIPNEADTKQGDQTPSKHTYKLHSYNYLDGFNLV